MARFYYIVNCYTLFQNQNEVNWQLNCTFYSFRILIPTFHNKGVVKFVWWWTNCCQAKPCCLKMCTTRRISRRTKNYDKHFWCAMSLWTSYLTMLSINVSYKWFDQVSRKFGLFWPVLKCTVKITSERIIYSSQWPVLIDVFSKQFHFCLRFSHCFYHNQGQRKITK